MAPVTQDSPEGASLRRLYPCIQTTQSPTHSPAHSPAHPPILRPTHLPILRPTHRPTQSTHPPDLKQEGGPFNAVAWQAAVGGLPMPRVDEPKRLRPKLAEAEAARERQSRAMGEVPPPRARSGRATLAHHATRLIMLRTPFSPHDPYHATHPS